MKFLIAAGLVSSFSLSVKAFDLKGPGSKSTEVKSEISVLKTLKEEACKKNASSYDIYEAIEKAVTGLSRLNRHVKNDALLELNPTQAEELKKRVRHLDKNIDSLYQYWNLVLNDVKQGKLELCAELRELNQ